MKKIFYRLFLRASAIAYSQASNVGINTFTPAANLDIGGSTPMPQN